MRRIQLTCTTLLISSAFNLTVGGGILHTSNRAILLAIGQIINLYGEAYTEVEIDPETQFQTVQQMADNIAAGLTSLHDNTRFSCLSMPNSTSLYYLLSA